MWIILGSMKTLICSRFCISLKVTKMNYDICFLDSFLVELVHIYEHNILKPNSFEKKNVSSATTARIAAFTVTTALLGRHVHAKVLCNRTVHWPRIRRILIANKWSVSDLFAMNVRLCLCTCFFLFMNGAGYTDNRNDLYKHNLTNGWSVCMRSRTTQKVVDICRQWRRHSGGQSFTEILTDSTTPMKWLWFYICHMSDTPPLMHRRTR